jgi:hypothetical protein
MDIDLEEEKNAYKFDLFKKSIKVSKGHIGDEEEEMEKLKDKIADLNHQRRHALENDTVGGDPEFEDYNNSKKNTQKAIAALKKKESQSFWNNYKQDLNAIMGKTNSIQQDEVEV